MRTEADTLRVTAENLTRYSAQALSLTERASANIDEVARLLAAEIRGEVRANGCFLPEGAQRFCESVLPGPLSPDVPPENRPLADVFAGMEGSIRAASLCRKTAALLRTGKPRPSVSLLLPAAGTVGGNVSFVRGNALSDAFAAFARKTPGLTPSFVSSFAEACEEVAAGTSTYCILPVENSRDGEMIPVWGQIFRYDLFLVRECVITSGDFSTKFALLCRGFRDMMSGNGTQFLTVRLSGADSTALAGLFAGASVLGASFVKTVALPLGYTDGYAQLCTFSGSGEAMFALLLLLSVLRMDFTLTGAYEVLQV